MKTLGKFAPLLFIRETPHHLMEHRPPFGFKFQTFKISQIENFRKNASSWEPGRYTNCAVVGNSGILKIQNHGTDIDSNDAVFRVNHSPVKMFSAFVGSKTTYHVSSSHWIRELRLHPHRNFLVVCDRPFVYSCQNVMFREVRQNVQLVNPIFYKNVSHFTGRSKIPLTGIVAVFIALSMCQSVHLFGFSFGEFDFLSERKICQYYYESQETCRISDKTYHARNGDSIFHDFKAHKKLLRYLNQTGLVRMH